MNKAKNKIWIGWLAFLFIIVHFSFIFIYALPAQLSNPQLRSAITPYVEPVFTQTWGMFAPCPTVNSSVEIIFFFGEDSTGWVNPIADAEGKHFYLRGSHHSELVLSGSNLYYWLSTDLQQMGLEFGDDFPSHRMSEFYAGESYYKIRNFIRGNAYSLYDSVVDSARIRFHLEDVVTGEKNSIELPQYNFH
ncbi:MAG: hypothetical protein GQ574_02370 [Crocinitomix sp.]|nr:hypothetical protein [Crocinitomix sp.]